MVAQESPSRMLDLHPSVAPLSGCRTSSPTQSTQEKSLGCNLHPIITPAPKHRSYNKTPPSKHLHLSSAPPSNSVDVKRSLSVAHLQHSHPVDAREVSWLPPFHHPANAREISRSDTKLWTQEKSLGHTASHNRKAIPLPKTDSSNSPSSSLAPSATATPSPKESSARAVLEDVPVDLDG